MWVCVGVCVWVLGCVGMEGGSELDIFSHPPTDWGLPMLPCRITSHATKPFTHLHNPPLSPPVGDHGPSQGQAGEPGVDDDRHGPRPHAAIQPGGAGGQVQDVERADGAGDGVG